jgi:hypothetical protein
MIKLFQIADKVANILKTDAAFLAYVRDLYGKYEVTCLRGEFSLNRPGLENCPFFQVLEDVGAFGDGKPRHHWQVTILFGINDEEVKKNDSIDGVIDIQQIGLRRVQEWAHLAIQALRENMPCNGEIDDMELIVMDKNPLMLCELTCLIRMPNIIGADLELDPP